MRKTVAYFVGISFPLIFFCCQKFGVKSTSYSNVNLKDGIVAAQTWLTLRDQQLAGSKKLSFDSLLARIDWANVSMTDFRPGFSLLMADYHEGGQVGGSVSKVAFVVGLGAVIKSGTIVRLSPDGSMSNDETQAALRTIYMGQGAGYSGGFSLSTIDNLLAMKVQFKNGKVQSYGSVYPLPAGTTPEGSRIGPLSVDGPSTIRTLEDGDCTAWYLITVTYYDDGSTSETDQYLYTTCPSGYAPLPGGGSGGGPTETQTDVVEVDTVTNDLTSPCLDVAESRITNESYKNFLVNLFKGNFDGAGADLNVIFNQAANTMEDGQPSPGQSTVTGSTWTVTLNNMDTSFSEEYNASVIIHELCHIYTTVFYQNNKDSSYLTTLAGQHFFMMQHFTGNIAALLQQSFGMSYTNALSLALDGYGDLWSNPTDSLYMINKFDITSATQDSIGEGYLEGTLGTKCQ